MFIKEFKQTQRQVFTKISRFEFFKDRNIFLKEKIVFVVLLFCLSNLGAQVTLGVEPGFILKNKSENLGVLLNVEPNIRISTNSVIGLRFGLALNPQKFENNSSSQFIFDEMNDNAVLSFMPTIDYYINDNYARPYIGGGIGYYIFSSVIIANSTENISEGNVNNQLGFLVRGGFEIGRTRIGLEYNLVPEANIEIIDGRIIGTVDNSYLGIVLGFTIGKKRIEY